MFDFLSLRSSIQPKERLTLSETFRITLGQFLTPRVLSVLQPGGKAATRDCTIKVNLSQIYFKFIKIGEPAFNLFLTIQGYFLR